MACEVCKHCNGALSRGEIAILEGYSYHQKCRKCYVCSETNLQAAEVFQGVIFCASCAQRIFQGCSMARKSKETYRRRRAKPKRRPVKHEPLRDPDRDGILELTTMGTTSGSDSSRNNVAEKRNVTPNPSPRPLQVEKQIYDNHSAYKMKKSSVDMGISTDVTQKILIQMNSCAFSSSPFTRNKYQPHLPEKKEMNKKGKPEYSDMRVAELGASTEIANMALRNKSELPVILKSESKRHAYYSLTDIHRESDELRLKSDEYLDSAYSSLEESSSNFLDLTIGSLLKLPFRLFQKAIVQKSSVISSLLSSESDKTSLLSALKDFFYQEITDHQKRGLKRLYSVINRKKIPNKMGWPTNMAYWRNSPNYKCKHFKRSHSYRCMRSQAMRLAGPTASELAMVRKKIKKCVAPSFLMNCITFNRRYIEVMSQSCGNSILNHEI